MESQLVCESGLGEIGSGLVPKHGYYVHPSLVIDLDGNYVLGLSDMLVWHRPEDRDYSKVTRKKRNIEDKESFKWILGAQNSKEVLCEANSVTFVQDREGDIYDSFFLIPDWDRHLLVRSRTDRKIKEKDGQDSVYTWLEQQDYVSTFTLKIKDNPKRKSRDAKLGVKFGQVEILMPRILKEKGYPTSIVVHVVCAEELSESVPEGEKPINWVLLTTHIVDAIDKAMLILTWYALRWLIEELFRISKRKGFDIEGLALKTGYALRRMGIMAIQSAAKVLQLKQARDGEQDIAVSVVFNHEEEQCLEELLPKLNGNTELSKNPFPREQLAWAVWIIARLGGWKGYKKQRPPGVITISRGLERFELIFFGWKAAKTTNKENEKNTPNAGEV